MGRIIGMANAVWGKSGRFFVTPRPSMANGPPTLNRPVGSIPYDGLCAQKSCLLTLQSSYDISPFFWPHSHGIANHFLIAHSSFHYSSSNTFNSGVLNGCVTEKVSRHLTGQNQDG
ncbi:hypothetical protein YC2023_082579 [Brassica napus]